MNKFVNMAHRIFNFARTVANLSRNYALVDKQSTPLGVFLKVTHSITEVFYGPQQTNIILEIYKHDRLLYFIMIDNK